VGRVPRAVAILSAEVRAGRVVCNAPHPSAVLPSPSRGEGPGERVTTAARSVPAPAIGPRAGLPHVGAAPSPRSSAPHPRPQSVVGAAPSPRFGRWNHHSIGPRAGLPHVGAAPSPRFGRGNRHDGNNHAPALPPRSSAPHPRPQPVVGAAPSPRFGRWNHHSIGPSAGLPHVGAAPSPRLGRGTITAIGPRAGLPHMGAPARGRPWLYRRRSGNNHAPAPLPRSFTRSVH
jgi:hypothetical protein